MLFSVSGVTVDPWIPPLVAFVVSFLTSMGGISGAFLLLPFQMSVLGYTHPSVSSTNQLTNKAAARLTFKTNAAKSAATKPTPSITPIKTPMANPNAIF
jgi:uncharacterized membrane protein YfcA